MLGRVVSLAREQGKQVHVPVARLVQPRVCDPSRIGAEREVAEADSARDRSLAPAIGVCEHQLLPRIAPSICDEPAVRRVKGSGLLPHVVPEWNGRRLCRAGPGVRSDVDRRDSLEIQVVLEVQVVEIAIAGAIARKEQAAAIRRQGPPVLTECAWCQAPRLQDLTALSVPRAAQARRRHASRRFVVPFRRD